MSSRGRPLFGVLYAVRALDKESVITPWKGFENGLNYSYSKVLRCMFLGEWKKLCSSKFVQLDLLNKAKARSSKNCVA